MFGLSLPEIIFLALIGLVVVGPKQLPEVARTIGRLLNELRRTSNMFTEEFRSQMKIDPLNFDEKPLPPHYNQPRPPVEDDEEAEVANNNEKTTDEPKPPGSENT